MAAPASRPSPTSWESSPVSRSSTWDDIFWGAGPAPVPPEAWTAAQDEFVHRRAWIAGAVDAVAPHAEVHVLRTPRAVRGFLADVRRGGDGAPGR